MARKSFEKRKLIYLERRKAESRKIMSYLKRMEDRMRQGVYKQLTSDEVKQIIVLLNRALTPIAQFVGKRFVGMKWATFEDRRRLFYEVNRIVRIAGARKSVTKSSVTKVIIRRST
jgi:hypothetical protein